MSTEMVIKSTDIELDKFTVENLKKMREAFPGTDDETLARYLIARNNELEKAIEQYTRCVAWKAANWPVLKTCCLKEISTGKLYVRGVCKEGRPLLIFRSCKSFPKERDIEESGRMLAFFAEHVIRAFPEHLSKFTLLIDRVGHKGENTDMDLMKHVSSSFQDVFPERLKRVIIYPSDMVFYTIWGIAKWFVDPVTRTKVQPMMYFSGVEEFVDKKHIPKSMGGDDDYEFSPDDYDNPYPEEVIARALAERAAAAAGGEEGKGPKEGAGEEEAVPETVFSAATTTATS